LIQCCLFRNQSIPRLAAVQSKASPVSSVVPLFGDLTTKSRSLEGFR